jgi:signal transduction histidine kinase
VPDSVQGELLAVVREALSNVGKHARAGEASITLEVTADEVQVQISDDGVGVPSDRHESGLRNARVRAEALGGSFELAPHQPRGTLLTWRVPIG